MRTSQLVTLCERFGGTLMYVEDRMFHILFPGRIVQFYCYTLSRAPRGVELSASDKCSWVRDTKSARAAHVTIRNVGVRGGLGPPVRTFYATDKPENVLLAVLSVRSTADNGRFVKFGFDLTRDAASTLLYRVLDASVMYSPGDARVFAQHGSGQHMTADTDGMIEGWLKGSVEDGVMLDWLWDQRGW